MKRLFFYLLCMSFSYTPMYGSDIKAVAALIDNIKYLVTRLMTASKAVGQVRSSLSEKEQQAFKQAEAVAAKPRTIAWSETLKSAIAYAKATTEIVLGGATVEGKEVKFQPGIIMAPLNMVAALPKALPEGERFNSVRDSLSTVTPQAAKLNMKARTWAIRLAHLYNILSSIQSLWSSFSGRKSAL